MADRAIVNIIGGFLGVGKTTAINELLAQRPVGEKWAVVVNEFGDIGIDGTLLGAADHSTQSVAIHEIPGGCICCTAGFAFQDAVVRLLRRERPHRLLIEPTGIATLRSIIDTLRQPGLAEAVELRTIITLVDPAHWNNPRHRNNATYRDQIEAADMLLANRSDLSEPQVTERFLREAGELFPPKRQVAVVDHGGIDAARLDAIRDGRAGAHGDSAAASGPADAASDHHAGDPAVAGSTLRQFTPVDPASLLSPHGSAHHLADAAYRTVGRTFPPETVFDEHCLADWVARARRSPNLLRLKGVFHTTGGWIAYNATPQEQSLRAASHRRDSRVEGVLATRDDELLAGVERCAVERLGAVQAPATE